MRPNERLFRTKRLDLVAATLEHLDAELAAPNTLESLLGVSVPPDWPPGEYDRDALEFFQHQLRVGGPGGVGWYSWYAITHDWHGRRQALVGCAGYLGPPLDGTVEIGYSIVAGARRQGYATELVEALVTHAFNVPSVQHVIAHASDSNEASTQVLLRCGFERVGPGSESGSVEYRRRRTP